MSESRMLPSELRREPVERQVEQVERERPAEDRVEDRRGRGTRTRPPAARTSAAALAWFCHSSSVCHSALVVSPMSRARTERDPGQDHAQDARRHVAGGVVEGAQHLSDHVLRVRAARRTRGVPVPRSGGRMRVTRGAGIAAPRDGQPDRDGRRMNATTLTGSRAGAGRRCAGPTRAAVLALEPQPVHEQVVDGEEQEGQQGQRRRCDRR